MKYALLSLFFYSQLSLAQSADTISLRMCQNEAIAHFPLLQQQTLLIQASQLRNENIQSDFLPEISLLGQAGYQSDVIQFPIGMPGAEIPELPKERWQAYVDIHQPIYTGGSKNIRKSLEEQQLAIDLQQQKVSIQELKPLVQRTYFSILLSRQSEQILSTTQNLLQDKLNTVEAAIQGGIALPSDALRLRSELGKIQQQFVTLAAGRNAALEVLSLLTALEIDENTVLISPEVDLSESGLQRPELKLLALQSQKLGVQYQLIGVEKKPMLSLFAQGGLGYPNPLNFFEISTRPYYQAGLRLQWNFLDWGEVSRKREEVSLQQQMIRAEEENLERNIRIKLEQEEADILQYRQLIAQDEEIIQMMEEIRQYASRQLDQGIITSTDYLDDINEEKQARLNQSLHRIQLIQAQLAYLTEKGLY